MKNRIKMNKLLNTILLTIIAGACFAQIPNSGFENWTSMGTYKNPDSWGTMNNSTALSSVFTATQGSPGSPGSYYLKLTSQTIASVVVNGIAASGVLDSITQLPKSGFPFSQRPQSFTGKWQHMLSGSSAGSVSVLLTRWNTSSGKRDTVATASQTLSGMVMSWAAFTITFTYLSGYNPDTCIIFMKASGSSPTSGDYLWVDNLAFSGSVTGIKESSGQISALNVYPNPANNEIEITSSRSFHNGDRLIISDMIGNVIFNKIVNENSFKINTSSIANGTYIYKLVNSFNVQFNNGKFTIQH
jgi:hypothetical protein